MGLNGTNQIDWIVSFSGLLYINIFLYEFCVEQVPISVYFCMDSKIILVG